jgi:hypothetical protein
VVDSLGDYVSKHSYHAPVQLTRRVPRFNVFYLQCLPHFLTSSSCHTLLIHNTNTWPLPSPPSRDLPRAVPTHLTPLSPSYQSRSSSTPRTGAIDTNTPMCTLCGWSSSGLSSRNALRSGGKLFGVSARPWYELECGVSLRRGDRETTTLAEDPQSAEVAVVLHRGDGVPRHASQAERPGRHGS